jgi:hypothetical protein
MALGERQHRTTREIEHAINPGASPNGETPVADGLEFQGAASCVTPMRTEAGAF